MLMEIIHEKDTTIFNMYIPKNKASKHTKQKKKKTNKKINKNIENFTTMD